jgi:aldose 1-epimerase
MRTIGRSVFSAVLIGLAGLAAASCGKNQPPERAGAAKGASVMDVRKDVFGNLPDGTAVDIYTLTNKSGIEARIMTYGAALVSLELPDRNGEFEDVTLGFDALDGYLGENPYFGCTVGRYANRIGKGRFTIGNLEYVLARNDGENHLHGGLKGFDKAVWAAEPLVEPNAVGVRFSYLSRDMEEGYPGNLSSTVTYRLTGGDELRIDYEAVTDKATPVNLTNHTYWNLAGQGTGDILDHVLQIEADTFTPTGAGLIPTGEILPVAGTPLDFATPHPIGERIGRAEGGYDHNFVLRGGGGTMALAALAYEPGSGRVLEILTDQPGIQFYSGNFLDATIAGKGGAAYGKHSGFCLETQRFPDSPNQPGFPPTVLEPGSRYRTATVHRFFTR